MITFKQLTYALAVKKTLHFKKAADLCSVSQSALSTAISELESHLGTQIFERDNKRVLITPVGQAILTKAQHIIEEISALERLSKGLSEPFGNPLSIGVIPTIGPYLLPKVLPAVRKKHPKAQLKLIEAQSHELIERVKSGEIDTAILALPYPHEGLLSLDFWEEDFYVVLNEQDEHSDQVSIKGQLLKNKSLLLLKDGHCLTDHTLKACRFKPQKDNISLEGTSLYTLVQMVANNLGTTLIPEMATQQLVGRTKELRLLPLDEKGPHRKLSFITRVSYPCIEDIQLLAKLFHDCLKR